MVTSSKFDLSSGSPDRPLHSSGQRGSHMAGPLDRSGSFRESMENPVLSSLPSMSRSNSAIAQGDVVNFLQFLHYDPKLVASDHKSNRQLDLKRHLSLALGISSDELHPSSSKGKLLPSLLPEEIKRVKAGVRECSLKARERVKTFGEALSVLNKFFPSLPSKKRSRSEGFMHDRSSLVLPSDRTAPGPGMSKYVNQSHSISGGFELEQQKPDDRVKNSIPNKRTRTSLVDMEVRGNAPARTSSAVDRDREMLRLANSGAVQSEERALSIGVGGWEKSKMKKKRSVIKPDLPPSTLSAKPVDGYHEAKQAMQQRPAADARSRLNNNSHGLRPVLANGALGVGKLDAIPQQTSFRSSIPRTDQESETLVTDRRDRSFCSDKERISKAVNKPTARDDYISAASPISNTKTNSSVRAPRSGSGNGHKLSPVGNRATAANDWEFSHCMNKLPAGGAGSNRKRTASTRSASPPVSHWATQRPQKISRTARRTNLIHHIPTSDNGPLDSVNDVAPSDSGQGSARRLSASSPQHVKVNGDPLFSAALSESEESGVVETRSREKIRKPDDSDDKSVQAVQKVSHLVLSSRKNKLASSEGLGDGVRRQGRTGRAFTSTRSLVPATIDKMSNCGPAKQIRSARVSFDKMEGKGGRPPTRKLSDRKAAFTRHKHSAVHVPTDFTDDGHEELIAAANAVINTGCALSNSFWGQMEPFFGFISDADITYLKKQGDQESTTPTPTPAAPHIESCSIVQNEFGLTEYDGSVELCDPRNQTMIPLCQRLIAALIPEEVDEDLKFDAYETEYELDEDFKSNYLNQQAPFSSQPTFHSAFNGYNISGKIVGNEPEVDARHISGRVMKLSFSTSFNSIVGNQVPIRSISCSESKYEDMQINEKLIMEIQSIGIFPELKHEMPQNEGEGIGNEISRLEEKYREESSRKKGFLDKLLQSAAATKELQEKEFEKLAMEKLVGMAYEKYMASRVHNSTGGKSSGNKMAKQAALAFVKRALEQCHDFEDTGKSCFGEPLFRDMFRSWCSNHNTVRPTDPAEDESGKLYSSLGSLEATVPASGGPQQSPSYLMQNADNRDTSSYDLLRAPRHQSEQVAGGDDSCSNRMKKRELLLDDVGGASTVPCIGNSLPSNTKGKRSERDGKGHNREVISRNGTAKIGRPTFSNVKGERKSKTKPKQKTAQLSVSVNGLVGNISEQRKPSLLSNSSGINPKEKDEFGLGMLEDPIDLSNLQLPEMDVLGVPDDLGGQGQDLDSWLNIDDDALQDQDFMGLEIPMDDLSDLNMMV